MTFWEQVAATRWGSYMSEVERRAILEGAALSESPGRALEVGCEGGRWSKLLSVRQWRMTCIDVDRDALAACQQNLRDARCILADVADDTLPVESESQSLVLCIEVPPVIHSSWFPREANRVLVPGGGLVAVMWNTRSIRGVLAQAHAKRHPPRNPLVYQQDYRKWREGLRSHGFEMVREEGFCWWPFGRSSNSRWIPFFTKIERVLGLHRFVAASPWIVFVARKVAGGSGQDQYPNATEARLAGTR